MSSEKRKVELITLNPESVNKKAKADGDLSEESSSSKEDNPWLKYENFAVFDQKQEKFQFINHLIQNYIKAFIEQLRVFGLIHKPKYLSQIDKLSICLTTLKEKNINFFTQKHFENLLVYFKEDIKCSDSIEMLIDFHNDLIIELTRLTAKTNIDLKLNKNVILKKVEKLTSQLKKIVSKIADLENVALDLDDLEEHNEYTKIPLFYKAALKLWRKREALLQRSVNSGNYMFKVYQYKGTQDEKVDKIIENYFNKYLSLLKKCEENVTFSKKKYAFKDNEMGNHFSMFTIIDLKKHLEAQLKEQKINFALSEEFLLKIYKDLLLEMKNRRNYCKSEAIKSLHYLKNCELGFMGNMNDPELIDRLDKSQESGIKLMETLIENFRKRDFELNGKNLDKMLPLGWDDKDDDDNENDESLVDDTDDDEVDDDDEENVLDIDEQISD